MDFLWFVPVYDTGGVFFLPFCCGIGAKWWLVPCGPIAPVSEDRRVHMNPGVYDFARPRPVFLRSLVN